MVSKSLVALATAIAAVDAQLKGFNYGSTFTTGAAKQQSDFEAEFNKANSLPGADCFNAARLYTNIQAGTANTPISAIPAAIATKTQLLLGLWASAGQDIYTNEIQALTSAIQQYGSAFTDLIVGISVGSEDLYRISPTGIENKSGLGANPDVLVEYIKQLRDALKNTPAAGAKIGHVDTWTAWVNGSNSAVIDAVDWLGHDGYPYFETTTANSIENSNNSFFTAYDATVGAAKGKPVWVAETGWPVSGPVSGQAVASIENAKTYWDDVACTLLGSVNTFWYTLQDAAPGTPSPSFGIIPSDLSAAPLYDLTCPAGTNGRKACSSGDSSSASSSSSSTKASSASSSVQSASAPSSTAATSTASVQTAPASESLAPSSSGSAPASSHASSASSASSAPSSAAPVSQSTQAPAGNGGERPTSTVYITTYDTITSCPGGCSTTVLTLKSGDTYVLPSSSCPESSAVASSAPSASSVPPQSPSSKQTSPAAVTSTKSETHSTASPVVPSSIKSEASPSSAVTSATTPAQPSGSACPANLNGEYQYPHLIVPVSKSNPSKAYGTQYNGTVSPDVSTLFNFDIPQSYEGQTCSLVFLFPQLKDLETSAYTFNGKGGIEVTKLSSPATEQTTFASVPSGSEVGSVPSLAAGNGYVVTSGKCAAGSRIGYELSSTGGLDLEFFNDYNPSPLGLYITVC